MSRTISLEEATDHATVARSQVIAATSAPPGVLSAPTTSGGTVAEELADAVTSLNRVLETLARLKAGAAA